MRKNLSVPQLAVQASHAAIEAAQKFKMPDSHPSVIMLGMKNESKLLSVEERLSSLGIKYCSFQEPDLDNSTTAIATQPVYGDQREIFKKYQLLNLEGGAA